jgi:hypothetical protein
LTERVQQSAGVESVDPCQRRVLDVVEAASGPRKANHLGLENTDQRLGERVIVRIATSPDRGLDAGGGQARCVANRQVFSDASIVLIDSLGRLVGGTLSDRAGRFALRAATPGTYRVRVRRIGFAPDAAHVVVLSANATIHVDRALRPVASLTQIVIRAA